MGRDAPRLGQRRCSFLQEVRLVKAICVLLVSEVILQHQVLATSRQESGLGEGFQVVCISQIEVGLVLHITDSLVFQLLNLRFASSHKTHCQQIEVLVCFVSVVAECHYNLPSYGRLVIGLVQETGCLIVV